MIKYKANGVVDFINGLDKVSCHMNTEQKIFLKMVEQDYEDRLENAYKRGAIDRRDAMRMRLKKIAESL